MKYMLLCSILLGGAAHAAAPGLDDAISQARIHCLGLSGELNHLKTMAGINTAVTGVGTAVGAGATVVGIAKSSKDKEVEELEKYVARLRDAAAQQEYVDDIPELTDEEKRLLAPGRVVADVNAGGGAPMMTSNDALTDAQQQLAQETAKSKKLGNWRTGLLAANTATNVAGTIIAANNRLDDELQERINMCVYHVKQLSIARMQAHLSGDTDVRQVGVADDIVRLCGAWEMIDLAQINAKAKNAMISSGVGAGIGLAGTITSVVANTDKTRNDNSDRGKQKEKNLNTAANVLAGGATVASGVATIFNATQIGAIKRAVDVATLCEEVL